MTFRTRLAGEGYGEAGYCENAAALLTDFIRMVLKGHGKDKGREVLLFCKKAAKNFY
jgi:hypothetical protein